MGQFLAGNGYSAVKRHEKHVSLFDSVIGKRFGRLTIIADGRRTGSGYTVIAQCDCGNVTEPRVSRIGTSCGCKPRELNLSELDLIMVNKYRRAVLSKLGKTSGYLVAIRVTDVGGKLGFVCRCICGNEVILKNDSFRVPNKGKSRGSCGCRDCYKRYRDCIDRVLGLNLKVLSEAVQ